MDRRLLRERFLQRVTPKPDSGFTPPPAEVAAGIWAVDRRLWVTGATLPTRSTVVDVGRGELLVISPPADACPGLSALGAVSDVVAPNSFHHLYAEQFARSHDATELFVAPGLPARVGALGEATVLTADAAPRWRALLDFVVLGPDRGLSEVLFFYRPSRTLILTDVAFNLVSVPRTYSRLVWRLSGAPEGFGVSRNARKLLLRNGPLARSALRAASRWPFERIVVAHGEMVEDGAREAFESAFAEYL